MNFEQWFNKEFPDDYIDGNMARLRESGWNGCKQEILKILKQPIQNCDLSWEEIDKRFIDKIEKEI